jgi:hypothetical protein
MSLSREVSIKAEPMNSSQASLTMRALVSSFKRQHAAGSADAK